MAHQNYTEAVKCPFCGGKAEPISFRKNYKMCKDCGAVAVPHNLYVFDGNRHIWRRKGESLEPPQESDVTNE